MLSSKTFIPFLILFLGWVRTNGQCPTPDFTLPQQACKFERIHPENLSSDASFYTWDYCETELKNNSATSHIISGSSIFQSAFCFDFIRRDKPYLIVAKNNGELHRVELSDDLRTVAKSTLVTGTTGAFNSPRALEVIEENGTYYALVANAIASAPLTLLNFGASISSAVSFVRLDAIGVNGTNGIEVIKQGDDYYVFTGPNSGNTIHRLKFEGSITAIPTVSSFTLTGASSVNDIEIRKTCDGIIGIATSLSSDKLFRLNFGSDITSVPAISEVSYTGFIINDPAKLEIAYDQSEYFAFVHTNNGEVIRLRFGDSLLSAPFSESIWQSSINGYDIDVFEEKNIWHGLFSDWSTGNRRLSHLTFENNCQLQTFGSNEADPSFHFEKAGTYSITLTAKNSEGFEQALTRTLTVTDLPAPTIDFSYQGICKDHTTSFFAISNTPIDSYSWNFHDGSTSPDAQATRIYPTDGEFPVSLGVTDANGCSNSVDHLITIYQEPEANFSLPIGLICTNNSVQLSNGTTDNFDGHLTYQWFVDDVPQNTERDLQYTFTITGPREIKLITSIPGCADEVTKMTSSVEAGPIVDFSYTGTCEGETFSFHNEVTGPVESYSWDFSNGLASADPNPEIEFRTFGDYSVSLTVTNSIGCENTRSKTVAVHSNPLVNFIMEGPPNGCSGSVTVFNNQTLNPDLTLVSSWLWAYGDQNDLATTAVIDGQHIFTEPGDYNVSLTATTTQGCAGFVEKVITVQTSPSIEYTHSSVCQDVPVRFSGSDANMQASYWEIGTSYYYTPSPVHTFAAPGDYPLHAEFYGANGCVSTVSDIVRIPVPLSPDFSVTKNCVGEEAVFTDITAGADPVASRTWTFPDGTSSSSLSASHTFTQQRAETVKLDLTTTSGCSYAVTKEVTIVQGPSAQFSPSTAGGAYPLEVTFVNSSANATTFLWDFDDGTSDTSTEESPEHTFVDAREFNVSLTVSNPQQCQDTFSQTISAIAPLPDVEVETINVLKNPDGSGKLIITIHNKGNTIIRDLPIRLDFEGKLLLQETLPAALLPAERFNFVFNSSIIDQGSMRYLCASLDVQDDLTPEDNRSCREFQNELYVFPAYPNPANDEVALEWMSPPNRTVTVILRDALGRTISTHSRIGSTGLNRQTLDVSALRDGVYFLITNDGVSETIQRILISGHP